MGIDTNNPAGAVETTPARAADGVLLDQFVNLRNHEAFAALMERHGPYLFGVCQRLTSNLQDAEDVFQACFLELVRNASSIRQRGSVGGWLQTVAVRLARKARTRRAQRRDKEASVAKSEAIANPDEPTWREVRRILEEEIGKLPEKLRGPIVLCLFEGQTREEAAQYLEISPYLLKHRLQRGRQKLQARLKRRGVSLAVLGALLTAESLHAVPPVLCAATVQGATALAAKAALTEASTGALALLGSTGILAGWGAAAAVLAAVLLGISALYLAGDRLGREPSAPPPAPVEVAAARRFIEVRRSFRDQQFDDRFFRWSGPRKYTRREAEGLRITLPAEKGPGGPVGVMLRYPVRGDFEVEATLECLDFGRSAKGWWAGATLYVYLPTTAHRDGLWSGKMLHPVRGPLFAMGQRFTLEGQERGGRPLATVPAHSERGRTRLRVERQGAMFHFSAAEGKGDMQHIGSIEIGADTVEIVRVAAVPVEGADDVLLDVRVVDFFIRAEEIVGYEPG